MLTNLIRNLFTPSAARKGGEVAKARALLEANHSEEVVATLAPWLERYPEDGEARRLRGIALLEMSRPADALPDLLRARELLPDQPRILYNIALARSMLGEREAAAELCKQVLAKENLHFARMLLAELTLPGESYYAVLKRMHQHLRPATYVEIGVQRGLSLRLTLPETQVLGVDPEPKLERPPGANQRVFAETSDAFFAGHDIIAELGGRRVDMAFIDGMHRFEYALRDFINIERVARRDTVVLVHDWYPLDEKTATREVNNEFWSGDIWRLALILKKYRPDLHIHTIGTPPTGLGLILNLDPQSRVLSDNLDAITAEFMGVDFSVLHANKAAMLNLVPYDWPAIQKLLDERSR